MFMKTITNTAISRWKEVDKRFKFAVKREESKSQFIILTATNWLIAPRSSTQGQSRNMETLCSNPKEFKSKANFISI